MVIEVELHAEDVDVKLVREDVVGSAERVAVNEADDVMVAVKLLLVVSEGDVDTEDEAVCNADCDLIEEDVIVFIIETVVEKVACAVLVDEIEAENVTDGELDELEVLDADVVGVDVTVDVLEATVVIVAVVESDFVPLIVISIDTVVDAHKVGEGVPLPLALNVPLSVTDMNPDGDVDVDPVVV